MNIVVTGGAGFIGSCLVRSLNDIGENDIIIVDDIASTEKWLNLRNKKYITYVHKNDFLDKIDEFIIDVIIHMGAQSSTTEKNFDYLWKNNFEYTKKLWNYCAKKQIRFIYASSAATYGDGKMGFDDEVNIDLLMPLNGYGYSKHIFDLWVKHQAVNFPKQYVGLKFFNVYGPNEYCKGSMASMVFHGFNQIKQYGTIKLFTSFNEKYADGEQLRDFVYVKDVCKVILWFLSNNSVNGLFNVGTGKAQSFNDLANATFHALGLKPQIEYITMPEHLRKKYQYFTEASINKLRTVGYVDKFMTVDEGVKDYVINYLNEDFKVF